MPEIGLCWGTVSPATLVETIEAAARHGFPTITVDPALYYNSLDAGLNAAGLRKRLADAGVRVRVIDGIWTGIAGLPSEPMQVGDTLFTRYDAARCLKVAEELGAPIISFGHYLGDPVPRAAIAEGVGAACRLARTARLHCSWKPRDTKRHAKMWQASSRASRCWACASLWEPLEVRCKEAHGRC